MDIRIKRIYDEYSDEDGKRVLVDRLWPRGIKKTEAGIDHWSKEIAPTRELRKWFGHDPEKWEEFRKRYFNELEGKNELIRDILEKAKGERLTLLYSARDRKRNNAVVLKEYMEKNKDLLHEL